MNNKQSFNGKEANNSIVLFMQEAEKDFNQLIFVPQLASSILTILDVAKWLSLKVKEESSEQDILSYINAGYLNLTKSKKYCEFKTYSDAGDLFNEMMASRLPWKTLDVKQVTDKKEFTNKELKHKGEIYSFPLSDFHTISTIKYKRHINARSIINGEITFHRDIIYVEYVKSKELMRFMLEFYPNSLTLVEKQSAKDCGITIEDGKSNKRKITKKPINFQRTEILKIWIKENDIDTNNTLNMRKKELWEILRGMDAKLFSTSNWNDFFKKSTIKLIFKSGARLKNNK